MDTATVFQCITGFFAVASLSHTLPSLNRMTHETHHGIRAAYVLTASGAFGLVVFIFAGYVPNVAETMFVSGIGSLTFVGRREHFKCPALCKKEPPKPDYGRRHTDQAGFVQADALGLLFLVVCCCVGLLVSKLYYGAF